MCYVFSVEKNIHSYILIRIVYDKLINNINYNSYFLLYTIVI